MDRATEQRVTVRQSDGAREKRIVGETEQISDGATERQSGSNKTKISRLLNCYRKIHDSRDLQQGFPHAPTVSVLEKNQ